MGRLAGFIAIPIGDKGRVVTAALLLLVVRVGIFVVSFARFRRAVLAPAGALSRIVPGSPSPARVAWAVEVTDRTLPGERTCLMRSMTSETIHRLYGHDVVHRIGVDPDGEGGGGAGPGPGAGDGTFMAHSWIEHDGEVLVGDLEDLSRFEPLPPLDGSDGL